MINSCNKDDICFAKRFGGCSILHTTYEKWQKCPFAKPTKEITNGKVYPYDPYYDPRRRR